MKKLFVKFIKGYNIQFIGLKFHLSSGKTNWNFFIKPFLKYNVWESSIISIYIIRFILYKYFSKSAYLSMPKTWAFGAILLIKPCKTLPGPIS